MAIDAEPERFLARVRELDKLAASGPVVVAPRQKNRTLGELFDAWIASPEWAQLKPQTRYAYERVIAPAKGALSAVRARPVREFTTPFVVSLRDAVLKRGKRWLANYTVVTLRRAFTWGRLHGWQESNPAKGVPLIVRAAEAPERNRAWTAQEFEEVWSHAPSRLRLAIALARYAGMRVGDVVAITWQAWDGERLSFRQSKTGRPITIRVPAPLRELLADERRAIGPIVANGQGEPYTRDGLQSNLWKLVKVLERQGVVKPGLCFHGLRHALGADLYNLGLDREARKAALGHTSDAASMVYERDGNRRAASDRAFAAFDVGLATNVKRVKNGQ